MLNWTPTDWGAFFIALGIFINTFFAARAAYLAKLAKTSGDDTGTRLGKKLDENTALTKAGAEEATQHAKTAAATAAAARSAAENVSMELAEQLNGVMDARITRIVREHVEPLSRAFAEHNAQDQQNMDKIMAALQGLSNKIK